MAESHTGIPPATLNLRPPVAAEPAPAPPPHRDQHLEDLRQRFRAAWEVGQAPPFEAFLATHPELAVDPEAVAELLHTEYVLRVERGDQPSLSEYARRFPDHVHGLEQRLRLRQTLSKVSSSWQREASTGDPPTLTLAAEHRSRFVGDYEVLEELGRGGMGVVYKARHRDLKRVVALKMVLRARFASAEELLRFRLEGEAIASLQHPNIVQLYEVGTHQDQPYLVLEYIEGGTLARRLRNDRLSLDQSAHLIETLARAVHVAHSHGIVHRDLKPGNVLLSSVGQAALLVPLGDARDKQGCLSYDPKITDFGLAKQMDRAGAGLTETGRVLGTPEYMAPEQAAGRSRDIGPATDVYALGAILYELLAGRPPFSSDDGMDPMLQLLSRDPVPLRRLDPTLPRDLDTIALKCLEKEPAKRYQSARDLADDLARFREGKPIHARAVGPAERAWKWARRRPVVAGLIAGLVLVSVLGFAGVSAALVYALEGWRQAGEQRDLAREQGEQAEQERDKAEKERGAAQRERDKARAAETKEASARERAEKARTLAEANVAFNRMARALLEWRQNNLSGSESLLSEVDLRRRGWQWRYLQSLHHGDLLTVSRPIQVVVTGLAFSPDGRHLAAAGGNPYQFNPNGTNPAEVAIFDVKTGTLVRSLTGFKRQAWQVAYSPNGKWLAASSDDETVRVWEANTGRMHRTFTGQRLGTIHDLVWSRDGNRVFASCDTAGLRGWDVVTGAVLPPPVNSSHGASCVAISPDGRWLAASADGVRLWDARSGTLVWHQPNGCHKLIFSPDSRTVAIAGAELVRICAVEDGRQLRSLAGHEGQVLAVAFSPCGQLLVTGGSDSTVRLWNAEEGRELSVWRGHQGRVESVAFHPGGAVIASGSAQIGEVKLWDATRPQECTRVTAQQHGAWVSALGFDPSGSRIYLQRRGGLIEGRDTATGQLYLSRQLPLSNQWRTPGLLSSLSGDSSVIAGVTRKDGDVVRAWRPETGERLPGSFTHSVPVWHVVASADGSLVASAARGLRERDAIAEMAVWEPATGLVRFHHAETHASHRSLALSADGRKLARGLYLLGAKVTVKGIVQLTPTRSLVEVWDVPAPGQAAPKEPRLTLEAPAESVQGLTFSRDGTLLAGCTGLGNLHIWRLPSGEPLHPAALSGPTGLEGLAFSPDGTLLAGVNRSLVTLWDVREGLEVLRLRGVPPRPSDGGFSPLIVWSRDGERLAATNWDHSVSVWDANDLALPHAKQRLRRAARDRRPRWHLENAAMALHRNQPAALRFHLEQVSRLGAIEPGWRLLRGDLLGSMGEWEQARKDYVEALLDPGRHPGREWRKLQVLLAWKGVRVEYTRLAANLLNRLTVETEPESALEIAHTCVLFPGAIADPARVSELVSALEVRKDSAWYLHVLALTALREGQYAEATARAVRSLSGNELYPMARLMNWCVLAQAHAARGELDEAQRWWRLAREGLAANRKQMTDAGRPIPKDTAWQDWLTVCMLERETADRMGESPSEPRTK